MNIANKLTLLRILLVPVLLVLMYNIKESLLLSSLSAALFIIISLTDTLDGFIARKYNIITDFGKFLDPLADKILVLSTMIVFIELGYINSIAVIIVIIREFLVTSLRLISANNKVVIAASKSGKLKTVIQMIVLTILMFTPHINNLLGPLFLNILIWLMVAITIYSGAEYLIKNYSLINYKK